MPAFRNTTNHWLLAEWGEKAKFSALQKMLSRAADPELISFALGLPDPGLLPKSGCAAALRWILETDNRALQYGPAVEALKEHIVELMRRRGVQCTKEQIFLTSGAQQGLNLLAKLFIRRDAPVLVESAVYPGFRQVLETCETEVTVISAHPESGIEVDHLQSILKKGVRPSMLFVNGGPHNPLTVSMGTEQRKRLVELAREHEFPIVEDDAYGLLHYEGPSIPPLYAMGADTVCYVGSLSKLLAPALRVGWIVAPEWIMPKLAILKEASDLDVATLGQRAAARMFHVIGIDAHLEALRSTYRARRDRMLDVLQAEMAGFASWHKPRGGFFIWVRLKDPVDTSFLLEQSMSQQKVAFMPGSAFSFMHEQRWTSCFRLSFSSLAPEQIEEGIRRLAKCLQWAETLYTLDISNA